MISIFSSIIETSFRDQSRKYYRCEKTNVIIEKFCIEIFKWSQHLRRHDKKFHLNVFITFVYVISSFESRKSVHTTSRIDDSCTTLLTRFVSSQFIFFVSSSFTHASSNKTVQSLAFDLTTSNFSSIFSQQALSQASTTFSLSSSTTLRKILSLVTLASTSSSHIRARHANAFELIENIFRSSDNVWSRDFQVEIYKSTHTTQLLIVMIRFFKKSNQVVNFSNIQFTQILDDTLFSYDVKMFKQALSQSKTLKWFTQVTKEKFDNAYEILLARWEVTIRHTKTCVLVSKEWRFSNSLDLMTLFDFDNYFMTCSSRAWYFYVNYETTLARVKVWFVKSSRTSLDFDVFLNCESYKLMNASHLCHHEHCIIHVIYEAANINQSRQKCYRRARFLREEKRLILNCCTTHNSSCMMQVSIHNHFYVFFNTY